MPEVNIWTLPYHPNQKQRHIKAETGSKRRSNYHPPSLSTQPPPTPSFPIFTHKPRPVAAIDQSQNPLIKTKAVQTGSW